MKKVSGYIFITLFIQVILFSSCKEKENESPTVKITTLQTNICNAWRIS